MLCLTNGEKTLIAGSDRRNAMSDGSNGRINIGCVADEFGDNETLLRGLFERRFGDGVNGGLPGREGNEGAHTFFKVKSINKLR